MSDGVFWDFTTVCGECGRTINVISGERVPSTCTHELPAVVLECPTEDDPR